MPDARIGARVLTYFGNFIGLVMVPPYRLDLAAVPSGVRFRRIVPDGGSFDTSSLPRANFRTAALPPAIVRFAFVLFVFSIPFETVLFGLEVMSVSLSRLTAYLLLATALLSPKQCFPPPPLALWLFSLFVVAFGVLGLLLSGNRIAGVLSQGIWLIQLLALFWLCFGLLRYERIAVLGLRVFAGGCTALALLQLSGVANVAVGGEGRYSVAGIGANSAGGVMALGALAVAGLIYGRMQPTRLRRLFGWGAFVVLAAAIAQTGSRGALVGLAVGLLTLLLARGSALKKLRIIFAVLLGFSALLWIVSRSEGYAARWQKTLREGSMAGREQIYPAAWQMFLERPVTGWGPVNSLYELGVRTNKRPIRGTHNLLLLLLTEVGIVGTIPYCAGVWLCLRGAWKARRGSLGILPLCLAATLIIVNMGIVWQFTKLHWLVLALGAASARPILQCSRAIASRRRASAASVPLLEGGMAATEGGAR